MNPQPLPLRLRLRCLLVGFWTIAQPYRNRSGRNYRQARVAGSHETNRHYPQLGPAHEIASGTSAHDSSRDCFPNRQTSMDKLRSHQNRIHRCLVCIAALSLASLAGGQDVTWVAYNDHRPTAPPGADGWVPAPCVTTYDFFNTPSGGHLTDFLTGQELGAGVLVTKSITRLRDQSSTDRPPSTHAPLRPSPPQHCLELHRRQPIHLPGVSARRQIYARVPQQLRHDKNPVVRHRKHRKGNCARLALSPFPE
jgi:hypothetical protein